MQTNTGHKKRRSSKDRKDIGNSQEQQILLSASRFSGRAGGQSSSSSSSGLLAFPVLKLTNRSCFLADVREFNSDVLLEIIPQILECLKNVPDYKDKKVWNSMPSLVELADHLLLEIRRVCPKDYYWAILKNTDEELELKYMKYVKGLDGFMAVPLEWLPALEAQNEHLHNIVLGCVYYIARRVGMDFLICNYDEYYIDDIGMRDTGYEEENTLNETDVLKYKKGGIVQIYHKEIRDFYSLYGENDLIDMITNFRPKGDREKQIKKWLTVGISVIKQPPSLDDYIIENPEINDEDGHPVTIKDSLKFPWSFYDAVAKNTEEWINDNYSNCGMKDSGIWGAFTKDQHILPESIDKIKTLLLFMKLGRDVYFNHYDKTIKNYYDKRRNGEPV